MLLGRGLHPKPLLRFCVTATAWRPRGGRGQTEKEQQRRWGYKVGEAEVRRGKSKGAIKAKKEEVIDREREEGLAKRR